MATNKPRFPITVEPEIAEIIENYRHQNKIKSTSKATVELLQKGINELYRQESKEAKQKNVAPTAEQAAEAMYEVLFYYLGCPPKPEQIKALGDILPLLCNGIDRIA